jgi:ABC-type lipoprotein export system ATPase subunit
MIQAFSAFDGSLKAPPLRYGVPLIHLREVQKVYQLEGHATYALRGINLTIHQGEFVAIVGQSGSGKSTLMNILGFLDGVSSGSYFFKGQDTRTFEEETLAQLRNKEIGFVFQSFHLLARTTAVDNVRLPLLYAGVPEEDQIRRAITMLERVGLGSRLKHTPNQLSGGQQQRVAIARALINTPSVILADEPTGNLDSASGKEIIQFFNELHAQGNTIILITHERSVALNARRMIEITDGRIVRDVPREQYQ